MCCSHSSTEEDAWSVRHDQLPTHLQFSLHLEDIGHGIRVAVRAFVTFVNGRLKCLLLLLLLLLLFGYSDLPASRLNMPRSTSYRLMVLNGHVSWTRREFSTSSSWTLSLVTCSRHAPLDLREADGIKYTSNASAQKERVHAVNVYFSFAKITGV